MRYTLAAILVLTMFLAPACAPLQVNPSFPVTLDQAKQDLKKMRAFPRPLARPVVVLGGYMDPGFGSGYLAELLKKATGDERVLEVSFFFAGSFDETRDAVIQAVRK